MLMHLLEFSVFLYKYDLKHDLFSSQVLKLSKENPNKQMSQKEYTLLLVSSWLVDYSGGGGGETDVELPPFVLPPLSVYLIVNW